MAEYIDNTQNRRSGVDKMQYENIGLNMTNGQIWPNFIWSFDVE